MKIKPLFFVALALILPVLMMMLISMSGVEHNINQSGPEGPCDIYAAVGNLTNI